MFSVEQSAVAFQELRKKSASERKLSLMSGEIGALARPSTEDSQFILFDLAMLCELLQPVACPCCSKKTLRVGAVGKTRGYAVNVALSCSSCGSELSRCFTSPRMATNVNCTRQPYAINHRAVLAAKEGGLCQTGLVRMTSLMNIRGSLHHKTFATISATIQRKLYGVAAETLSTSHRTVHKVYEEVYGPCEGPRQLAVSYDGTWKKRGFQSPIGVGFVIDTLTGLVLDYAVLSRYCIECELVGKQLSGEELEMWQHLHEDSCTINHRGSSGSMETEAAKVMWARSVELLDAEYTSLLGDGDAAVLSALKTLQPYGPDVEITKHECINHISKRMFRGLDMAVKDSKTAVGCGLGGKGKLTQVRMKQWSQYYRNAIVKHAPNVAKTRDAIWAIYEHNVSTQDQPQHDKCDVDWCWWQQAMAAGLDPEESHREGRHDPPLPLPAAERLLPLFERLTKPDLLKRCMSLGTSNANESLHSLIWRRAPKAVFASRGTVEIACALGIVQFNRGGQVLVDAATAVLDLPESPNSQLAVVAASMDRRRIRQAIESAKAETKTNRKRKALTELHAQTANAESEGHLYSAGSW